MNAALKNSTPPAASLIPATSFLKDKFHETNWAICQASYLAHFLASTISQQVEDDANVIKIESPASEGFLMVLKVGLKPRKHDQPVGRM